MEHIAQNLAEVRRRIAAAAQASGRNPEEIALVAVSKTKPREIVESAIAAGQLIFGENKVQESIEKYDPALPGIELHLVGHLQSNKSKSAAQIFDRIHSIDSFKTAQRLDRHLLEAGRTMKAFVQVNLGLEEQKSGVDEKDLPGLLLQLSSLKQLTVDGLMVLPPFFYDATQTRPFFQRLRKLKDQLSTQDLSGIELKHLSMGMTNDFEEAIAEGATMVRVGTAIFGQRNYT